MIAVVSSDSLRTLSLLLEPLATYLPTYSNLPLKLYFNMGDGPAHSALHSILARSRIFARESELWPEEQRLAEEEQQKSEPGWDYACPSGARFLKKTSDGAEEGEGVHDGAFAVDLAISRSIIG